MYRKRVEYLDRWKKPMDDFTCFTWMTLNDPLKWNYIYFCPITDK